MNQLQQNRKLSYSNLLLAFLISGSIVVLIYARYLQTVGYSVKRAFFGVFVFALFVFVIYVLLQLVFEKYYDGKHILYRQSILFWLLLSAMFVPHILPIPHYPQAPVFQKSSKIEINFRFLEENDEPVQLKGVWLSFDNRKIASSDFVFSNNWEENSNKYFIDSASQGRLSWQGKIGERAKLTIFPLDTPAEVTVTWDGEESTAILLGETIFFNKKSSTPIWYYGLITSARVVFLFFLLLIFFSLFLNIKSWERQRAVVFVSLFLLSTWLVYSHFQSVDITEKLDLQISYHNSVLAGNAPSPWQYRPFSEWVLEGGIFLASLVGLADSFYFGALLLRVVQNTLIYFLAYFYYRKLGFIREIALIGVFFLSGSLLNSFLKSGFSFNTYFDVIFYLIAGLLILRRSFVWFPLLMVAASLNRETSGLIPFLALSVIWDMKNRKTDVFFIIFSLICWAFVFITLRIIYPGHEIFIPYDSPPGISLLIYNLSPAPFGLLIRFFSLTPIIGLAVVQRWSRVIKIFFVVLVPIWFGVHLIASVIGETRLFLVPQTLIFIPAFLFFVESIYKKIDGGRFSEQNSTLLPL